MKKKSAKLRFIIFMTDTRCVRCIIVIIIIKLVYDYQTHAHGIHYIPVLLKTTISLRELVCTCVLFALLICCERV